MAVNDELGKRMKEYYEQVPKTRLVRRMPVALRLDGKAFHSFTRGFKKPFDEILIKSMQETMKKLCENIQGCVLGYTQSDEITLVLVDYQRFESCAWFDYEIQKICSISASMATMAFNKFFAQNVKAYEYSDETWSEELKTFDTNRADVYKKALEKGAMFDARVFNIPKEEVTNCVYWRQLDASRNSIQMVGQANFSHKELHCKTCNDIQDMLMLQKNINWNDFPTHQKRGTCVIKSEEYGEPNELGDVAVGNSRWIIDKEIPIFKGEGREYIDRLVMVGN